MQALVVRVRGTVQGVGFRPAMWRLARAHGLAGLVRNDGAGVWIEVEGPREALERFLADLPGAAPEAARVDGVEVRPSPPTGRIGFEVARSGGALDDASIPPDLAPCAACLSELADPADRRHHYPFASCTSCGPRFTIVASLPYDRARTTMAGFPLCEDCRGEYEDPADRRFHAEPVACPACGPQLTLRGSRELRGEAALQEAAALLRGGAVLALKGVGGYALVVDATREEAVARLRERKRRPHKPFAVLARDLETAGRIAVIDEISRSALVSPARPIVLLPSRDSVAPSVAPGLGEIGVFLPPSPLQHLLLHLGPPVQVSTSGNAGGDPLAKDEDELAPLAWMADAVLVHDRPVLARADDSVVRVVGGHAVPLRRARGYVPDAITLPVAGPPLLATGGERKSTVCLASGRRAVLSQHLGDLGSRASLEAYEAAIAHLRRLTGIEPRAVACDLHPDWHASRFARATGLRVVEVQHHHAHVASCLAEHGRVGRVVGVAFDGTGYGPDGTVWGGEILSADLRSYRRVGHLRPLRLLGGEAAIREPWRLALAALLDAGEPLDLLPAHLRSPVLTRVWEQGIGPLATGAGRWFDAVAALCGVCLSATWDGQAAAMLESVAGPAVGPAADAYPLQLDDGDPFVVDLAPAVREIALDLRRGVPVPTVSARFHETMARAVWWSCGRANEGPVVALSGGCFQNRRLAERAAALLRDDGFEVLTHRRVPPNDGGLALGQAAVAAARLGPEC